MQKTIFADPLNYGGIDISVVSKAMADGWKIISIVPQAVSISQTYSSNSKELYGGMLFLLEKDETIDL